MALCVNLARCANMPLTKKGKKIYSAMQQEYGSEKGRRIFYAAANKGSIKGVDFKRKKHK
jgi:hypothetical protein